MEKRTSIILAGIAALILSVGTTGCEYYTNPEVLEAPVIEDELAEDVAVEGDEDKALKVDLTPEQIAAMAELGDSMKGEGDITQRPKKGKRKGKYSPEQLEQLEKTYLVAKLGLGTKANDEACTHNLQCASGECAKVQSESGEVEKCVDKEAEKEESGSNPVDSAAPPAVAAASTALEACSTDAGCSDDDQFCIGGVCRDPCTGDACTDNEATKTPTAPPSDNEATKTPSTPPPNPQPCWEIVGQYWEHVPPAGGFGGKPGVFQCAAGKVVNRIKVSSGDVIDAIAVGCQEINFLSTSGKGWVKPSGSYTKDDKKVYWAGGDGGGEHNSYAGKTHAFVGWSTKTCRYNNNYTVIAEITLFHAEPGSWNGSTIGAQMADPVEQAKYKFGKGSSGGNNSKCTDWVDSLCNNGDVMTGVQVMSGIFVDRIQPICGKVQKVQKD